MGDADDATDHLGGGITCDRSIAEDRHGSDALVRGKKCPRLSPGFLCESEVSHSAAEIDLRLSEKTKLCIDDA